MVHFIFSLSKLLYGHFTGLVEKKNLHFGEKAISEIIIPKCSMPSGIMQKITKKTLDVFDIELDIALWTL